LHGFQHFGLERESRTQLADVVSVDLLVQVVARLCVAAVGVQVVVDIFVSGAQLRLLNSNAFANLRLGRTQGQHTDCQADDALGNGLSDLHLCSFSQMANVCKTRDVFFFWEKFISRSLGI